MFVLPAQERIRRSTADYIVPSIPLHVNRAYFHTVAVDSDPLINLPAKVQRIAAPCWVRSTAVPRGGDLVNFRTLFAMLHSATALYSVGVSDRTYNKNKNQCAEANQTFHSFLLPEISMKFSLPLLWFPKPDLPFGINFKLKHRIGTLS